MVAKKSTTAVKEPDTSKDDAKDDLREILEIDPADIRNDQIMAITHYVRVKSNSFGGTYSKERKLIVEDLHGGPSDIDVSGDDLLKKCRSADLFSKEEKVTKTQAAEILSTSFGPPFTVVFEKQDGEGRTLRGVLKQTEPLMGRSYVEDLDIASGHRLRLVDHRSIQSIIINGKKFTVKK